MFRYFVYLNKIIQFFELDILQDNYWMLVKVYRWQSSLKPVGAGWQNLLVTLQSLPICWESYVAEQFFIEIFPDNIFIYKFLSLYWYTLSLPEGAGKFLIVVCPGQDQVFISLCHSVALRFWKQALLIFPV